MEAPDASAVADFFRVSPWEAVEIRRALRPFVIADMLRRAEEEGYEPIIWVSLDDSATRKDKDTHALEAVDWIFDHSTSGKGQTAYCKGAMHVTLRVQIGSYSYTFAWRLCERRRCGGSTVDGPKGSGCASRASTAWHGRCWRNSVFFVS